MAKKVDAEQSVEAPGVVLPVEAWEHVERGEAQLDYALRVINAAEKCGVECDEFRKFAKRLGTGFAVIRKTWARPDGVGQGD